MSNAFSDEPMRLPREERQQLVAMLAGEGMSTRAIAPIVGVNNATVQRDITGVANATPAPASDGFDRDVPEAEAAPVEPESIVNPFTGEILEDGNEPTRARRLTSLLNRSMSV
jgi:hypothetical protein